MIAGLFLLSAAALAFEVNLTRVFSVAQFYHFAFMTVSLALLGFGASGTLLSLAPGLARRPTRALLALSWGFALTALGSYALILLVPFDSFRIALDPRQWGVLALHYVALASPFLCAGAAVGLMLTARPEAIGRTYAANLAGSAAGCLLAVTAPSLVGAEGMILLTAALGAMAAVCFPASQGRRDLRFVIPQSALVLGLLLASFHPPAALEIRLSPYKALSYALQYPDSRLVFRGWNGFSRVDVVESSAIRSLPGQGFACTAQPPPQKGLFVDGDDLSPITYLDDPADLRSVTDCLLTALPYRLRPGARALVVEPRGGFDLLVALAEGAGRVTAVEPNPLVVQAIKAQGEWAGNLYEDPRLEIFTETGRAFLARPGPRYGVILLSLSSTYHPVTSGAYSLAEDYRYTVEGFTAALERLEEGGLLVINRWLQVPPSESLRAFALAVEAVERSGGEPGQSLVALRSYNQMLILVRRGPFTPTEVDRVRAFAAARFFDVVYLPGIRPEEVNRFNVLPSPDYYRTFAALLAAEDRDEWLARYPYNVDLPTDDRPFFGHFFRWRQLGEVVAMTGHVWQPFGGAGYLVLLALLTIAMVAAGLIILLPLAGLRTAQSVIQKRRAFALLAPFGLLGLAYLFVEIPLLARFILFLGQPAYAMATVLGVLLMFSGLGSLISSRVRLGPAMGMLVGLVASFGAGLPLLSTTLLRLPFPARLAATMTTLAPLGILMGIPFPHSLALLQKKAPTLTAWAWGVNGALSVIASILAATVALSWGFRTVLTLGALCYLGALVTMAWAIRNPLRGDAPLSPDR